MLSAREEVLRLGGLLQPHRRLLGHSVFPLAKQVEGLIIDDFFALGVEQVDQAPLNSFAATALSGEGEKRLRATWTFGVTRKGHRSQCFPGLLHPSHDIMRSS